MKTTRYCMISNWLKHCKYDVIWTAFQLFFKLDSHIAVLSHFCRLSMISEFSFLGIGINAKIRKSRKTLICGFIGFKFIYVLSFNKILKFLRAPILTNKSELNLINIEGEKYKCEYGWIFMRLIPFYQRFKCCWSYIFTNFSIMYICRIYVDSEFPFLGIRPQTNTWKSWKTLIYWLFALILCQFGFS